MEFGKHVADYSTVDDVDSTVDVHSNCGETHAAVHLEPQHRTTIKSLLNHTTTSKISTTKCYFGGVKMRLVLE